MQKGFKYEKAAVKDVNKFHLFFAQSLNKQFPQYTPKTRQFFIEREYSVSAIESQLKAGVITIYLALSDENVIGYLMTRNIVGGICLATWLAVSDLHKNQGIASNLLEMWEQDSKKRGIHKLHLETDKKNLGFYKKRGFTKVGMIPKNYYGVDDYLFYKAIQEPKESNFLK